MKKDKEQEEFQLMYKEAEDRASLKVDVLTTLDDMRTELDDINYRRQAREQDRENEVNDNESELVDREPSEGDTKSVAK